MLYAKAVVSILFVSKPASKAMVRFMVSSSLMTAPGGYGGGEGGGGSGGGG